MQHGPASLCRMGASSAKRSTKLLLRRHAGEVTKWEALVAEAKREQAAAAAAAADAQRAQQLAESSRGGQFAELRH